MAKRQRQLSPMALKARRQRSEAHRQWIDMTAGKWLSNTACLTPNARKAIEARWAKYVDPENFEYEWEHTERWQRHAINAVQDLVRAEARIAELEKAIRLIQDVVVP